MSKTKRVYAIIGSVIAAVAAIVATAVILLGQGGSGETAYRNELVIDIVGVIPPAYTGESYDLRQVVKMEEGVEYTATACYQNYKTMTEVSLPVEDLTFTPEEDFDIHVELVAKKGNLIGYRALEIQVIKIYPPEDDLLAKATYISLPEAWPGEPYSYDRKCTDVSSEDSYTSWKFSSSAAGNAWPVAALQLDQSYDMEDCILQFDIKFENGKQWLGFNLFDENDNAINSSMISVSTEGEGWQTVQLRTLDIARAEVGKMTKVKVIQFWFNFEANTGVERAVYLDNMKLIKVPVSEEELRDREYDMLSMAANIANASMWSGEKYAYDKYCTDCTGENSARSWKFTATAAAKGWPIATLSMPKSYDLRSCALEFDVKFENAKQSLSFHLCDKDGKLLTSKMVGVQSKGSGWQRVRVEDIDIEASLAKGADLSQVRMIQFWLNFEENTGMERAVYVDNMRAVKVTVSAQEQAERDSDLFATSKFSGNSWTGKVYSYNKSSNVVYGNKSLRSWEFSSNGTSLGWPIAYMRFRNAHDLTGKVLIMDVKFEADDGNPNGWLGICSFSDPDGKAQNDGVVSVKAAGDGWHTVAFDLSKKLASGKSLKNIQEIGLMFNFDGEDKKNVAQRVYIDNVRIGTWDGDFVESVSADEKKERDGDIFATAKYGGNAKSWDGSRYGFDNRSTVVNSENSLRSWKFTATGTACGWPIAYLDLANSIDLTDKILTMDVKFEAADGNPNRWLSIYSASDSENEALLTGGVSVSVTEDGWQTVSFDLSTKLAEGKSLTDVKGLGLMFNFDGEDKNGVAQSVYIDNVRMEDATEKEPEVTISPEEQAERDSDLFADAKHAGSASVWNGNSYGYDAASTTVNGENSLRSWEFFATGVSHGWPIAYMEFAESVDLTGKLLVMDVKFEAADGNPNRWLNIYSASDSQNEALLTGGVSASVTEDGWQTVSFDLSKKLAEGKSLADVKGLGLMFNFDGEDKNGVVQSVYIDNVRIENALEEEPEVTEPEETEPEETLSPEEQAELDSDLFASAARVGAGWDGTAYGYDGQSSVVTGSNSLRSSSYYATGTSRGWPIAYMELAESVDLTGKLLVMDVKFEAADGNPNRWLNIYSASDSQNEALLTGGISVTVTEDSWQTVSFDLSAKLAEGKSLTDVKNIGLMFNFDGDGKDGVAQSVYIDNVRIENVPEAPEPETTEPESTEPETTEPETTISPEEQAELDSDLFATATRIGAGWDGSAYGYDGQSSVVMGSNSLRSSSYYATGTAHGWPIAYMELAESIDLTGKLLVMDVKFESADGNPNRWLHIYSASNSQNEALLTGGVSVTVTEDGWQTVSFDLSGKIADGKSLTDVKNVGLMFNFDGDGKNGVAQSVYIDNVRIMSKEQQEQESDLFATATFVGAGWNGTAYAYNGQSNVVTGNKSWYSRQFFATGASAGWPIAYMELAESVDLTGKLLVMDVKFESADGNSNRWLRIYSASNSLNEALLTSGISVTVTGDGWQRVSFNLTAMLAAGKSLTDVKSLGLMFNFDGKSGVVQSVYIDNVRLEDDPQVQEKKNDLLASAVFSGAGTLTLDSAENYGSNSQTSWAITYPGVASESYPVFYVELDQAYDLTKKRLVMEVKMQTVSQFLRAFRIQNSTGTDLITTNSASANAVWEELENGWYRIAIDCDNLPVLNGKDLKEVKTLAFILQTNPGDNVLWLDNLRIEDSADN